MGLGPDQVRFIAVWIDMLPADGWRAAKMATSIFEPYPYVAQFHDPNRLVGEAVAASIGAAGQTAWDMYLFYKPPAQWKELLPEPYDWVHQLEEDEWAQGNKFHWGEQLSSALRSSMQALLGK